MTAYDYHTPPWIRIYMRLQAIKNFNNNLPDYTLKLISLYKKGYPQKQSNTYNYKWGWKASHYSTWAL